MSLQVSVMEKTVASRDKIVSQLYERLEQLEELLKNQARRTKVSRLVDDCVDLKSKVSERNEILMSSNVEAVVSEASASSNKVNDHCRFVLDSAREYLVDKALTSQSSGRSSKKSSTSSKRSKMLLKLQEEELERQAEARKAILETEVRVKQLEIDEYKRQQLQKYRDECQLDEIESNSSESDCNVEDIVQTKTSEWVNSLPPSTTVDSGPSHLQPKSNLVEKLLHQTSQLNEKPPQVVDVVTSQSSFVNNSVGTSLPFVDVNAPSKATISSTGVVGSTFGSLTIGNKVVSSNNETIGLIVPQSSLASTLPSNIDNSLQNTYVLPSSQLGSLPTAAVSHSKAALPSYGPSRAPIASTGNVLHPISGMSFSNFSLLNSQPPVGVQANVNTSNVAPSCTVNNNSARLAQQPNPQIPFLSNSATQPPIYPVPSSSNFDPNILQSFLESQIAHESLPKFELDVFSGDPLKRPDWKGMFESTCCKPSVSLDHRMRYLKLFTSGKAKATIDGFGYLGVHSDQAFASLQKRFGAPHIIVGAQIEKLSKHPQVKMHNSASIIEFSQVVNSFVSVLSAEKFFSDLQSSSNLSLVVSKLPINLRESWFGFIERLSVVNLITFRDWLQQKASVHERLLMSNTSNFTQLEKNDKLRKHQVLASNVVKSSNNSQSANVRKDQCPSCNQSHKIWKCSSFLSKSVKQRSAIVREKQLCFTCLQSGQMARDCSSKLKCRKSGCGNSHNSLLHNDTSSSVGSGSKNENGVTSCTVSRARKGALQVIEIGLKSGSSNTKAWALCDTVAPIRGFPKM